MSVYAGPEIVSTGQFLYLDAGNSRSYPGSGTTWTDLIGNKTASMVSTTYSSINGGVINHNGTNAYSTIANTAYTLGSSFSIEIWAYWNSATPPASNPWTGCLYTNSALNDWNIGAGNNNGLLISFNSNRYISNTGAETGSSWTNPTVQAWHQYVFTFNSGTGIVYVDNQQVNSASNYRTSFGVTLDSYGIGKSDTSGPARGFWNGYISNFKLYIGKTLTAAEIRQNYNALRGRFGV